MQPTTFQKPAVPLSILLVLLGASARLLPHPANFAPITAIALFGGLYLPRRLAIILPLVAMFVSDIFIGFYDWRIMASVYGSFLVAGLLGLIVRKCKTLPRLILATLTSSLIFFFITNAAVWAFSTMYPHNPAGLMESYLMALPFFRNSLLGDLFYTAVLVGGFETLLYFFSRPNLAPETEK